MFTFGIFSTHLPYLAFVFFYAFFFLFGMQKVADDDLTDDEKYFRHHVIVVTDHQLDANTGQFNFNAFDFMQSPEKGRTFSVDRKTTFFYAPAEKLKPEIFYFSFFSRPPPII